MCATMTFSHLLTLACEIPSLLDCEPEEVDDWSPEANNIHCSFCSLPLEKLSVSLSHHSQQRTIVLWIKCDRMFNKLKNISRLQS